jgi:hypothetical protein
MLDEIATEAETATTTEPAAAAKPKAAKPKKAKTAKAKATANPKVAAKPKKASTAADRLEEMLLRKSWVTHREAKTALRWKSCLPYLIKIAEARRIKIRKERLENGEVRYYGEARGR